MARWRGDVEELDLSSNLLEKLPNGFGDHVVFEHLDLSHNRLSVISENLLSQGPELTGNPGNFPTFT